MCVYVYIIKMTRFKRFKTTLQNHPIIISTWILVCGFISLNFCTAPSFTSVIIGNLTEVLSTSNARDSKSPPGTVTVKRPKPGAGGNFSTPSLTTALGTTSATVMSVAESGSSAAQHKNMGCKCKSRAKGKSGVDWQPWALQMAISGQYLGKQSKYSLLQQMCCQLRQIERIRTICMWSMPDTAFQSLASSWQQPVTSLPGLQSFSSVLQCLNVRSNKICSTCKVPPDNSSHAFYTV